MTDEQMHARLQQAGERWRDGSTEPADHDEPHEIAVQVSSRATRRHWMTVLSAAVVAAAVVLGVALVLRHDDSGRGATAAETTTALTAVPWSLPGTNTTVVFAGSELSVSSGCDSATYSWRADRGRLAVDGPNAGSACGSASGTTAPAPANPLDRMFPGTVSWSIHDDRLTLSRPGAGSVELTGPPVAGGAWKLVKVATTDWPGLPVDLGSLHVGTDGRIAWNDGCNSRDGHVRVTATTLTVTDVGGSEVHCSGDPIVAALGAMLKGTVTYSIQQHELTLRKPGVGRLVFEDAANLSAPDPAELRAHPWTLTETETSYTNGNSGGGSASPAASLSRVTFADDGTFTVEHRCYTDKGDVAIHNARLTLTRVTLATAIPCASNAESAGGQKENDVVDRLLTGLVTWQIAAGVLTLTKGNDSGTFAAPAGKGRGALVASPWTLTTIDNKVGPSSSSSSASARVVFSFTQGGASSGRWSSTAKFDDSSIAFGGWTNDRGSTGPQLEAADATFVYQRVLTGVVSYRITANTLTITKPGVGELVLTRS